MNGGEQALISQAPAAWPKSKPQKPAWRQVLHVCGLTGHCCPGSTPSGKGDGRRQTDSRLPGAYACMSEERVQRGPPSKKAMPHRPMPGKLRIRPSGEVGVDLCLASGLWPVAEPPEQTTFMTAGCALDDPEDACGGTGARQGEPEARWYEANALLMSQIHARLFQRPTACEEMSAVIVLVCVAWSHFSTWQRRLFGDSFRNTSPEIIHFCRIRRPNFRDWLFCGAARLLKSLIF